MTKADSRISDTQHTSQGVRKDCCLLPTLFNIYIDNLIKGGKQEVLPDLQLPRNISINNTNTSLFADYQFIMYDDKHKL